jgi:hypothetical protein
MESSDDDEGHFNEDFFADVRSQDPQALKP